MTQTPPETQPSMPPKGKGPAKKKQRVIVEVDFGTRNGRYRIEKPKRPQPKWRRDDRGRLVSNLPSRPNIGGGGDLECFYHVARGDGEVLPPPQALWTQKYGDDEVASYRPVWTQEAGNLVDALRRRSEDSDASQDFNGRYGLPYLYLYDEDAEPDEQGRQCKRWRPLQILANGGYGVVVTYVDESRGFTGNDEIPDDDKIVAKFNYKEGDLVGILASVIRDISLLMNLSSEYEGSQLSDDQAGPSRPSTPQVATGLPTPPSTGREAKRAVRRLVERAELAGKIKKINREMARSSLPTPGSGSRAARSGRRSSDKSRISEYLHFEKPKSAEEEPDIDSADTFRIENRVLQLLDMTGSPHFPKLWKLADPPQDGTLCTMDYIPGARTLDEQFDLESNREVPIRLMWESILCLSKALSVMAYGSEDPAPSHRVHGWNEIVHFDWSERNIFVRQDSPSHTCSHDTCFMVGDFGFSIIVPSSAKAKAAFRLGHLKLGWQKELADRLPVSCCRHNVDCKGILLNTGFEQEAQIDTRTPLQQRIDHPVLGHFSYKANIFGLANILREKLGGPNEARSGHRRYTQDNLTSVEKQKLWRDLETYLPPEKRCGKPLEDNGGNGDEDEDDAPRVRGYLDVAESLMAQPVVQDLRVAKQRFVELVGRCLDEDPAERPEIEEIMLSAARGIAEAGAYVPPTPSSSSSSDSGSEDQVEQGGTSSKTAQKS